MEEIGHREGNHADADADSDEHQIGRTFKFYFRQGTDATGDDHAEHGDTGTTQYGVGNAGDDSCHFGQQAQPDEDDTGSGDDEPAFDTGQGMRPTFWANAV